MQLELPIIHRSVETYSIDQRITDGYINATALCQASGKKINHYLESKNTIDFINELSSETGITASALIQVVKGGVPTFQGTWIHPQVAINLAQWASPKFAVLVSKWVVEWMSGNIPNKNKLPYHLQRYMINRTEIPMTHFSVFNEIIFNLIAPLENEGYELPDKLVPDISEGRMFASWLRKEKGIEPNDFPTYRHTYPDGRSFPTAKLYPNSLLNDFREHFYKVWIIERAKDYFIEKDKNALPYLEKVILKLPQPTEYKQIDSDKK